MKTNKTKTRKQLTQAQRFFYEHSGYGYNPKTETAEQGRIRCAIELAKAEEKAAKLDWCFCWEYDESGCSGCDCDSEDCDCSSGEPHETLCCLVRDYEGKVLASLGGICGATPTMATCWAAVSVTRRTHERA